ncbi:MAG: lytic transglycosylase domain-containing protein [Pyrinomonadaceae bacterium]
MRLTRKSVPVGITVAALLMVLSQAEAKAAGAESSAKKEKGSYVGRRGKVAKRVRPRRAARQMSRLRERAAAVEPLIAAAAIKYRVDPYAIWAIAYKETRFRAWLVSPVGAQGLMQFMPGTAAEYGLRDPFDVAASVDAAARYVRKGMNQFGGRLDLVWASYNAGFLAVEAYSKGKAFTIVERGRKKVINASARVTGGVPPYRETQDYVAGCGEAYRAARRAGLFSEEVVARSRMGTLPDSNDGRRAPSAYPAGDPELANLTSPVNPAFKISSTTPGTAGSTPKSSPLPTDAAAAQASARRSANAVLEEVFFDVHSGARYVVRGGEIVRPLEADSAGVQPAPEGKQAQAEAFVAKSVYYGAHSE